MIPVDQTIFDNHYGNCWAACLASIFEVPLESVPWPNGNDDDFWPTYHAWLNERNATVISLTRGDWTPSGYAIGGVMSPRFEGTEHAVVVFKDRVVHDPHPSKASLSDDLSKVTTLDLIFPLDPSKPMAIKEAKHNDIDFRAMELHIEGLQVEVDNRDRAILKIRKALTGSIHSTSDLIEDIAKLKKT